MAGNTVRQGSERVRRLERSGGNGPSVDWPQPRPIAHELRPVPPFQPETLLPEVLRAWMLDDVERMPCPPDYVAAALVALGSLIGARCAIKPKQNDSWLIVPNLWGALAGDRSSTNYLPKLAKQYGLLETATERAFVKAMREMVLSGKLVKKEVGRDSIRHRLHGLVLP